LAAQVGNVVYLCRQCLIFSQSHHVRPCWTEHDGEFFPLSRGAVGRLRRFRLIPGYTVGPSINSATFANENEVPSSAFSDLEAEHPIDRQLAMYLLDSTVTGVLQSGQRASLPRFDVQLLRDVWLAGNDALAKEPQVGGPRGIRPKVIMAVILSICAQLDAG
jgi:hypothetical protein